MALGQNYADVQNNQKILYLFTSTEHPYHKDVLDILALPTNTTYRFRYDLKYLPPNLQTNEQFNEISKNIILVHVQTTPLANKKPADIIQHFPIREAQIIDLKFVGTFVWIEFLLGDWFEYEKSNDYHKLMVEIMPDYQKTELRYTVIAAPKLNYSRIQEDLSKPYENSLAIQSWSNLINLLMQTHEHKNSIFLKFASMSKLEHDFRSTRQKPIELGHKIYGFQLKKNETYRIEVLQRTNENPNPKFDLEIFTDTKEIRVINKTDKVQGKYDVLDFVITAENLPSSRRSFFLIRPEKDTGTQYTIPRLHFDVDIIVSKSWKIITVLMLGSGVFLSGIATSIQNPTQLPFTAAISIIGGILSSIALYVIRK